jgi:hypothetical protein
MKPPDQRQRVSKGNVIKAIARLVSEGRAEYTITADGRPGVRLIPENERQKEIDSSCHSADDR